MARILIDLGTPPSGKDGDPVRTAFEKINAMTDELYATSLRKVSSQDDPTVGRAMTVPYMGIGAKDNATFAGVNLNPDGYTTGGVTIGQFLMPGGASTGYLFVLPGSASSLCGQIFMNASSGSIQTRCKNNNVWLHWESLTGEPSNPAFNINDVNAFLGGTTRFFTSSDTTGDKPFLYGWVKTLKYGGNYCQIANEAIGAQARQATRIYVNGAWQAWNILYGSSNTTRASDGTLKAV